MVKTVLTASIIVVAALLVSASGPTPEAIYVEKEVTKVFTEVVQETIKETVIVEGTPEIIEKEITRVVEVEELVTATPESAADDAKIILRVGTGDSGEGLNPHQRDHCQIRRGEPRHPRPARGRGRA